MFFWLTGTSTEIGLGIQDFIAVCRYGYGRRCVAGCFLPTTTVHQTYSKIRFTALLAVVGSLHDSRVGHCLVSVGFPVRER